MKLHGITLYGELQLGALVCFDHFDAGLEGFFEVGNMGDGEDAGEVGGDLVSSIRISQ